MENFCSTNINQNIPISVKKIPNWVIEKYALPKKITKTYISKKIKIIYQCVLEPYLQVVESFGLFL